MLHVPFSEDPTCVLCVTVRCTVVAKSLKTLAQNNTTVKIVQSSQSIYNVSILLAAVWHTALAGYAMIWIEQVFHKDLVF